MIYIDSRRSLKEVRGLDKKEYWCWCPTYFLQGDFYCSQKKSRSWTKKDADVDVLLYFFFQGWVFLAATRNQGAGQKRCWCWQSVSCYLTVHGRGLPGPPTLVPMSRSHKSLSANMPKVKKENSKSRVRETPESFCDSRKFLQIRKVFATSSLLAEEFPDISENVRTLYKIFR